ncbi:uncharacterized protein STEHIDRAFT_115081 [Stereum hirsutum FP-91666 SS1]|uniref:uncharacterized protein n=1 Tax=Stereum hirsutum (strain FP-91666) TaxID=721885 RepID=UPI0004449983|nr:uncharacterized protein STEHIDRAFT_115081 [Stereum hirsutum FP-91666 SS1]EIM81707.1 hypothetical protein STEHIDRAFT_115081 [Stereum hirsutum FP-91666 SS1]
MASSISESSSTPIFTIPPELIARCFAILAEEDPPTVCLYIRDPQTLSEVREPPGSARPHMGFLTITHICRRWRDIALNMSSLWSTLTFMLGPRWLEEMLRRSKSAPLTIHHNLDHVPYSWKDYKTLSTAVIGTVEQNLHRIKSLSFNMLSMDRDTRFPLTDVMTKPSPLLEDLTLSMKGLQSLPSFPDSFLGGQPSNVRRLCLDNVGYNWAASPFVNLSILTITVFASHVYPLPSYDELFAILNRNQHLEKLCLHRCLPSRHATKRTRYAIQLPSLTDLDLHGDARSCAQVLDTLELQPGVMLTLQVDLPRNDDGDCFALFAALSSHGERHEGPFRSFAFNIRQRSSSLITDFDRVNFYLSHDPDWLANELRINLPQDRDPGKISVSIFPEDLRTGFDIARIPQLLVDTIATVKNVEMLAVHSRSDAASGILFDLKQFHNVRYLKAFTCDVIALLHRNVICEQADEGTTSHSLSSLVHLYIQGVDLLTMGPTREGSERGKEAVPRKRYEQLLIDIVRVCRLRGSPLRRLTLIGCKATHDLKSRMREADPNIQTYWTNGLPQVRCESLRICLYWLTLSGQLILEYPTVTFSLGAPKNIIDHASG